MCSTTVSRAKAHSSQGLVLLFQQISSTSKGKHMTNICSTAKKVNLIKKKCNIKKQSILPLCAYLNKGT